MASIGIEAVRYYDQYRLNNDTRLDDGTIVGPPIPVGAGGWIDLDYCYNITNGFYDAMTGAGEECKFYWAGEDVWELDLRDAGKGGLDKSWLESVDLWFFNGHSYINLSSGDGAQLVFNSNADAWFSASKDWKIGDLDCDWIALYTCESLVFRDATIENYLNIFSRLHILLGSYVHMLCGADYVNVGRAFAENLLDGDTVSAAWFDATGVINGPAALSAEGRETWHDGQPDYSATTLSNDHYWGRGETRPDRPASEIGWLHYRWLKK